VKVYLIRHAQSEENVLSLRQKTSVSAYNDMICYTHATPLTRWGHFQAQLMVGRLDGARIERIYTSPFDRAVQTATIIGNEVGISPQMVDDLREVVPHQLKETDKDKEKDLSLRRLLLRSCVKTILPGGSKDAGEKLNEGYRRAQRVWTQLTSDTSKEIAIVSHYGLISLLLFYLDRNRNWRIITRDLSNSGVSIVVRR